MATAASAVQAKAKPIALEHDPILSYGSSDYLDWSLRHNPLPVSPARQCCSRLRRPALLPEPGRRLRSRLPRGKQPIQRGPGTRQRRILRACAQQRTLAITQLGVFRKDDLFEVVLDPGPDKLENVILGPAPSKRSTGVRFTQPRRQAAAKQIHSIGPVRTRQFRHFRLRRFRFWVGLCGDSRPRRSGRAKLGCLLG